MGTCGRLYLGRSKTNYSNLTGTPTVQSGVVPPGKYYLIYVHLIAVTYTGPVEFVNGTFGYTITTPHGTSSDLEQISNGNLITSWRSGLIVAGPGESYSVSVTAAGFTINSMAVYIEEFAAHTF